MHTAEHRQKFHKFKEAISLVAQIERDEAEFRVVKQHNQCACLEFFLQFAKLRVESITHLRENKKRVRVVGEIFLREIDLDVAGNYLISFNPFQYLVVTRAGFDSVYRKQLIRTGNTKSDRNPFVQTVATCGLTESRGL